MTKKYKIYKIYRLVSNPFGTEAWDEAIGKYGIHEEKWLAKSKVLTHTQELGQIEAQVSRGLATRSGYRKKFQRFFSWDSIDEIIRYAAEMGYEVTMYDQWKCPTCGNVVQTFKGKQ